MTPAAVSRMRADGVRRSALLLVFALAVALRVMHLHALDRDWVSFHVPVVDASEYHEEARARAAGTFRHEVPIHGVLYPILLGTAYEVTDGEPLAVRYLQLALAVLTWVLVAWLGTRLVGGAAAAVAAGGLALWRPALLFDAELYAEGTTGLVLLGAVFLLTRALASERWRWTLAAAFACGLATIARSNLILMVPVGALLIAAAGNGAWRRRLARAAAFAACAFLPILPVTLANHAASGEWILLQARRGHNLYMANHPDAEDGAPHVRPGPVFETFRRRPIVEAGARGPSAESAFYAERFRESVQRHPMRFVRGLWNKLCASFSPREVPSSYDPEVQARFSAVARWPLPGFAVLLPFLFLGLWAPGRDRAASVALLATLAVVWVSLVLGFAAGRYRHQASPLLWLVGGVGIVRASFGLRAWRAGWNRRRVAGLAALAVGTAIAFLAPRFEHRRTSWQAEVDQLLAYGHWVRFQTSPAGSPAALRELELARAHAARAVAADPTQPQGHYTLGLLAEVGRDGRREGTGSDPERALAHYAAALAAWPSYPEAHENRGRIFARTGRVPEAIAAYEAAVALEPERFRAFESLASLYARVGRAAEAAAARARFELLRRASPRGPGGH